ncbi:MAG: phosphate propanoyltransferase [Firmicutes bacterium]|nr:phosphate propanoyltransferase [Bacillota bacterium]
MSSDVIDIIVEQVRRHLERGRARAGVRLEISVGVSGRHVHLSEDDCRRLFGEGHRLEKRNDLSQPGQFACMETVLLAGPRGALAPVRVLGPLRKRTQVEVSRTDCLHLGIPAVVRESGDLSGSTGAVLVGPRGSVALPEGVIVARRHVHMQTGQAASLGLSDGQNVLVVVRTGDRRLIFSDVALRVRDDFSLEFHADTDEANAAGLQTGDTAELVVQEVDMP